MKQRLPKVFVKERTFCYCGRLTSVTRGLRRNKYVRAFDSRMECSKCKQEREDGKAAAKQERQRERERMAS